MTDQIYSPDGEAASWVLDLAQIRMAGQGTIPGRGNLAAAEERMSAYGVEVADHVRNMTPTGHRVLRAAAVRFAMEGGSPERVAQRLTEFRRQYGIEHRDASTGAMSLGTFTPTQFWLDRFALFRSNAAPIIADTTKLPLPPTGMTVDVPTVQTGLGATVQSSENSSAGGTTSPSVTYAAAAVQTATSQQYVSQQVLDRTGPGISYDEWHARQAAREIATAEELKLAASIVTGAQVVTDNTASAAYSAASFWQDVANAAQLVIKAPPPALRPTRAYAGASYMYAVMAQFGTDGRPVFLPMGGTRGGDNTGSDANWTGYQVMGSDVYLDDNLSGPSAGYGYVLVGDPEGSIIFMEADPIVDVYPETAAATLTASVNARQYFAYSILYPTGWAAIKGSAYPATF